MGGRRARPRVAAAIPRGATEGAGAAAAGHWLSGAASRGRSRGQVPSRPALPRNDRPRRKDAGRLRVDSNRGEVRHLGVDPRPDRLGKGSRRADDSRAEQTRHRAVPGGQLRGAARHVVRIGALWLREGRLHRRERPQARPHRARQQRHAVPRRDRRSIDRGPGQAPARARGAEARAPGRPPEYRRQLQAHLGHQPAAGAVRAGRPFSRGPLLPRQRVLNPPAVPP